MNTKTTLFKAALMALFVLAANMASAATYYTCKSTVFSLAATLPNGTTALWDVKKDGSATSLAGYPSTTAPTSFADEGSYEIILVSQTSAATGECSSDPISNTIIVLPGITLTLADPTQLVYCEGVTGNSDVVATIGTIPTYAGLTAATTFSVTKDGSAVTDISTIGTVSATTFKLTTNSPGVYVITGRAKYAATNLLGDGCEVTSTKTVTVTTKPTAPTITITAI